MEADLQNSTAQLWKQNASTTMYYLNLNAIRIASNYFNAIREASNFIFHAIWIAFPLKKAPDFSEAFHF